MVGGRRPGIEFFLGGLIDIETPRGGRDVEALVFDSDDVNVKQISVHAAMT